MENLNYSVDDYNEFNHLNHVEGISRLAGELQSEQTLRVCVGASYFRWDIAKLKHSANKLKQDLFGRIFGFTPSVWVESILTSDASRKHFVYLDVRRHKQKLEAA